MKRAQVTIFVILGLIFLAVVVYFIGFKSELEWQLSESRKLKHLGLDYAEGILRNNVNDCLFNVMRASLRHNEARAGHINAFRDLYYAEAGAPAGAIPYPGVDVPVVLDYSGKYLVTADSAGQKLCNRAFMDLYGCLNLDFMEDSGFAVSYGEPVITDAADACIASLRPESTSISLRKPISLTREQDSINVSDFYAMTYVQYAKALEVAGRIIDRIAMHDTSDGTNYSISDHCAEYEYSRNVDVYTRDYQIVEIIEKEPDVDEEPFVFRFAIRDFFVEGECTN